MERRYVILSLSLLLTIGSVIPAGAQDHGDLAGLTRIRSGLTTKRISSYDRTGGNNDRFENIKPGEVRELFNVKGAGMINHIWIMETGP